MSSRDFTHRQLDLLTPEEAAKLMSERAGYKITPDDIKQLRHRGKIQPARQLARTTLYKRAEIEQAPIPKKHNPEMLKLANEDMGSNADTLTTPQSWRGLLSQLIRDDQERLQLADALGINPVTLTRWITGRSNPRQATLNRLLEILPQYRQQLSELIAEEFPHSIPTSNNGTESDSLEIPSAFYARLHHVHVSNPSLTRASSVCSLILQQMLEHLDPQENGMAVFVAQCVPSASERKVHSLRKTLGRGTASWKAEMENWTLFLGAESLTGRAVMTGHPIIIQNREKWSFWFPAHSSDRGESSVACPILLADQTAGSLCVISVQENYFSQPYLELIQKYANLMALAFEHNEFYDLRNIELGIMPPYSKQQLALASFQQRVTQYLIQAAENKRLLTRLEAEAVVWQELEEELLQLAQVGISSLR